MTETKSPGTIEMPFARFVLFYSTIRWKLFLITTEQPRIEWVTPRWTWYYIAPYCRLIQPFIHRRRHYFHILQVSKVIWLYCVCVCLQEHKIVRQRGKEEMSCKTRHISSENWNHLSFYCIYCPHIHLKQHWYTCMVAEAHHTQLLKTNLTWNQIFFWVSVIKRLYM